jgi:6-phosphofructokinase 1
MDGERLGSARLDTLLSSAAHNRMNITTLGEARFPSPISHAVDERVRVPFHILRGPALPDNGLEFEVAGPRAKLFFDPKHTRAGIVTCGGLCPGLNNVIRSAFLELHHIYGVKEVLGFRDGYRGLDPSRGQEPFVLTPDFVEDIHKEGGTVLNTSRGPVDIAVAVDNLIQRGVNILFTVGGDGTQRGGNELFQEAQRRGHALSVVGIPKTIDNDVPFVSRTFGYLTAVEEAVHVITCAHMEAHSVHNGISIVKLMGRNAGFIAASATVASQDVNFCLVPEVPFTLEGERGFLAALKKRVLKRAHAVIVVAEGAGQDLVGGSTECDASGNVKQKDIGLFLKERVGEYFKAEHVPATIRYIDPSYIIRSVPADAEDAILCDRFARDAVHAAMAGKTGMVIGLLHDQFTHVPIQLLATQHKQLDPHGLAWRSVLAATGQPAQFS